MGGTSESAPLIAAYYGVAGANAATPQWAYQHNGSRQRGRGHRARHH